MYDQIISACRFLLNNYPEAEACRNYLNSRISLESQELFQFGYMPGINHLSALISILGEEPLRKVKLFYTKEIEDSLYPRNINFCYFENYPLIMPFRSAYGEAVALVGRTLLSEDERKSLSISKYKNTTPFIKGNFVFGLFENKQYIIQQDCVYVVEGQFDVIKAKEYGFNNVVALGTSNMSSYQFSVITRYTKNIYLLFDNDEAGLKGRKLAISKFSQFANIKNRYLPDPYKDLDEYCLKNNICNVSDFIVEN